MKEIWRFWTEWKLRNNPVARHLFGVRWHSLYKRMGFFEAVKFHSIWMKRYFVGEPW